MKDEGERKAHATAANAERLCHDIITFIDARPVSEFERYAALLAATHAQRTFMLEGGMKMEVYVAEKVHDRTVKAVAKQ